MFAVGGGIATPKSYPWRQGRLYLAVHKNDTEILAICCRPRWVVCTPGRTQGGPVSCICAECMAPLVGEKGACMNMVWFCSLRTTLSFPGNGQAPKTALAKFIGYTYVYRLVSYSGQQFDQMIRWFVCWSTKGQTATAVEARADVSTAWQQCPTTGLCW